MKKKGKKERKKGRKERKPERTYSVDIEFVFVVVSKKVAQTLKRFPFLLLTD